MANKVCFDLPKIYQQCASMAERIRHRCRFLVIFINLFYETVVLLDCFVFKWRKFKSKVRTLYDKWTTFEWPV